MANAKKQIELEIHSTEKTGANGNKWRSWFLTAINGKKVPNTVGVTFTSETRTPKFPHAIITIDMTNPTSSHFGKNKRGYSTLYVSDPFTETEVEAKPTGTPLSDYIGFGSEDDPELPF